MKLPVIKHLQRNNDAEKLQNTIDVLESFTEHRSVSDQEMDIIGELLTNLCGAVEVHKMIDSGDSEMDAANNFVKKVMGSIDR
ncbi:hypothetical protein SAMN04487764_2139 [Gillisia sp. Hel1_33_143]|uniref:DUF6952 family protein n=1 Tax=unclassified Gillisia TaxID=2615025 RepID=UPI00054D79BD|nr:MULTISPECIES: hypothetical protein [unclassified Gillisia]SDS40394.1 hypothetical protein SAMN04487764_2139 [Gillisia sp. Hel1_33_143]